MDYKKEEIKEYFDDWIADNKEWLEENHPNDWKDDLHYYAFNDRYYIDSKSQAKEWLGDMAFNLIDFIKDYEQENFGKVYTDLSEPKKIVNMYAYIIG